MNIFSAFDTGVMVALLLGIEFLRSDIQTILYCKRNDPGIFKSCLYTLFILLASLYSIVAGAMLNPEPVPVYELMPGFQIGVYGSCFCLYFLLSPVFTVNITSRPFGVRYGICNRCTDTVTWICSVHDELFRQRRMIMKIKDVFQRKWITDSITKRRYPFQIPSMTGRLHIYPNFRKRMKSEIAMHFLVSLLSLHCVLVKRRCQRSTLLHNFPLPHEAT